MPFHRFLKKAVSDKKQKIRKRRNSSDTGTHRLLTLPEIPLFPRVCCGRAALCTFRKASLTVEASVVLPLFLIGMIMLVGVMDVCRVQTEENAKLAEQAKNLSMYAYAASAKDGQERIDLCRTCICRLPVNLFPFSGIPVVVRARVHTWTGRSETEAAGKSDPEETLVYMTEGGSVYHTSSFCTYLDLSIYSADVSDLKSLRNEYGSRYHACEKCGYGAGDETSEDERVFLTGKGEKYHTLLSCSGLTRKIKMIKITETGGIPACSRCG